MASVQKERILPTISFPGRTVSFSEGSCVFFLKRQEKGDMRHDGFFNWNIGFKEPTIVPFWCELLELGCTLGNFG